MYAVESPACKLCGTEDVRLTYREEWRGQEYSGYYCRKCDVYQTLGNVADLSPQYHSLTDDDLSHEHIDLLSSLAHRGNAFHQWKDLMVREGGPLRGRLLDIGCGVGGFLNFAAELGIECHGFDASAPQVAYASRAHQNVVQAITMDDYLPTLSAGTEFRYFTLWDVLEHIPAPLPLLEAIRATMRDESLLYISVPSGGTIWMKQAYYGLMRNQLSLCPWEHVFYYTPKSLRAVLERSGFKVVEIGGVATYERPISPQEVIRRAVTKGLSNTRYALQIYAIARRG